MCRFAFLVLAAISVFAASAAAQSPDKKPFLAGAATCNIAPWLGHGLVGNFGTPPPAKQVHDELHARCFVLDDGTARVALVVSDSIYISREVPDEAKRMIHEATGLPADRMLMSCTHTHSSVSAAGRTCSSRSGNSPSTSGSWPIASPTGCAARSTISGRHGSLGARPTSPTTSSTGDGS